MIQYIEVEEKVNKVKDVICDCCGESCLNDYNFEYMLLRSDWGFGTKYDGELWEAHICEKCVDEKLTFIKFKKKDKILL